MRNLKVEVSKQFQSKLFSISEYYDNHLSDYSEIIYNEITERIESLEDYPYLYPIFYKQIRKITIPSIKYNIYYQVMEEMNTIFIIQLYAFKEEQTTNIVRRSL